MSASLGFIGLGTMGRPMAGHLLSAGHRLFVNSRSGVSPDLVTAGATACRSGRDVAARSQVLGEHPANEILDVELVGKSHAPPLSERCPAR